MLLFLGGVIMKKYKWLLILVAVVAILSIIAVVFSDSEEKYLKEISINEVIAKKKEGDKFILYIKQTSCEHCKAFTPRFLSALRDSKLKAFVLNLTNLSEDEKKIYDDNFDVDGTPTVLFFEDGSESMIRIEGEQTKDKILSKLESAGYIKK